LYVPAKFRVETLMLALRVELPVFAEVAVADDRAEGKDGLGLSRPYLAPG